MEWSEAEHHHAEVSGDQRCSAQTGGGVGGGLQETPELETGDWKLHRPSGLSSPGFYASESWPQLPRSPHVHVIKINASQRPHHV